MANSCCVAATIFDGQNRAVGAIGVSGRHIEPLLTHIDVLRQTARNLWHDGELLRWRTWKSAAIFFFGKHGLVRHCFKPWLAYFKADFHPLQQDGQLAVDWLQRNVAAYSVVSRS